MDGPDASNWNSNERIEAASAPLTATPDDKTERDNVLPPPPSQPTSLIEKEDSIEPTIVGNARTSTALREERGFNGTTTTDGKDDPVAETRQPDDDFRLVQLTRDIADLVKVRINHLGIGK
jgi:hypothetical protein